MCRASFNIAERSCLSVGVSCLIIRFWDSGTSPLVLVVIMNHTPEDKTVCTVKATLVPRLADVVKLDGCRFT